MSFDFFNCRKQQATVAAFEKQLSKIHCVHCIFNTVRFIYMSQQIGTHLWHAHQTGESASEGPLHTIAHHCTPLRGNMSFSPATIAKWRTTFSD